MGHKYAPIADLIDWCRYPEMLSFLIKNRADISLQIDDGINLIDELDGRFLYCQLEFYEGQGLWLGWAISYMKRLGTVYCSSELYSDGDTDETSYSSGRNISLPDYSYKGFPAI